MGVEVGVGAGVSSDGGVEVGDGEGVSDGGESSGASIVGVDDGVAGGARDATGALARVMVGVGASIGAGATRGMRPPLSSSEARVNVSVRSRGALRAARDIGGRVSPPEVHASRRMGRLPASTPMTSTTSI